MAEQEMPPEMPPMVPQAEELSAPAGAETVGERGGGLRIGARDRSIEGGSVASGSTGRARAACVRRSRA